MPLGVHNAPAMWCTMHFMWIAKLTWMTLWFILTVKMNIWSLYQCLNASLMLNLCFIGRVHRCFHCTVSKTRAKIRHTKRFFFSCIARDGHENCVRVWWKRDLVFKSSSFSWLALLFPSLRQLYVHRFFCMDMCRHLFLFYTIWVLAFCMLDFLYCKKTRSILHNLGFTIFQLVEKCSISDSINSFKLQNFSLVFLSIVEFECWPGEAVHQAWADREGVLWRSL